MVGKIGANTVSAQNINNNLEQTKSAEKKALERIAAERAIDGKDTSDLLIADALMSQISTLGQGVNNANEAIGVLQIADAALNSASESAGRMVELSVAYNSAALNSDQKSMLNVEASRLQTSISDAINSASYNGKSIFGGDFETVTGYESVSAVLNAPDMDSLDITSQESIEAFIDDVSTIRSDIGSAINEMSSLVSSHLEAITNLTESESKLQNNDIAENYNELNAAKLKENAGLYAASYNTAYLQTKLHSLLA